MRWFLVPVKLWWRRFVWQVRYEWHWSRMNPPGTRGLDECSRLLRERKTWEKGNSHEVTPCIPLGKGEEVSSTVEVLPP